MKRVAILGRGAAGKSTLATELSDRFNLPLIELDALFWKPGPTPTPPEEWHPAHQQLIAQDHWIIDGDLGDYDSQLDQRLARADTIVILDLPLWICLPRALRRPRETREFWCWLIHYRRDSLPRITTAARRSTQAHTHTLRNPREVKTFLANLHDPT